ncbi:MAG: ABC transporter substrate-binding protein, partial [Anaerolineales bacterium]|nr:ABC transporter substrate-binding protein [Anaerolineales bacterium]
MRRIRWQILIAVGGLLLILALLLQQSPEPGTPELLPQKGGSYVEGLMGSVVRLNPVLDYANQADRDVDRLLYSGLVRFDSRGVPEPDLAESWAVSADATLYTFTLRPDATWHDGLPVTSDDVIYTFSKMQDEDFPGPEDLRELWSEINIIRLDDRNVQFQLPEPFAPFMDYLALGLLPEHLLRGVSAGD